MSTLEEIRDLRKSETSLYVKNNTRSIVSIEDEGGRVELGPQGSDSSIHPITYSKLDLPGVQKMITRKQIEVGPYEAFKKEWEESEESEDQTPAHLTDFQVTVEADRGKKDLAERKCLVTGKPVFQTLEEVQNDKPPLHESVAELEREFVVRHVPKAEGGYEVVWDRVKIG